MSITEDESLRGTKFLSERGINISQSSSAGFVALKKLVKKGEFLLDNRNKKFYVYFLGVQLSNSTQICG